MPKTTLYIACTLDGFIAGKNDDISWLDKYNGPDEDYGYSKFIKKVSTVVMGRTTYDVTLKFGENQYKDQKTYILTSDKSLKPRDKATVVWTKGFKALVKELAKVRKGIIWLVGGGKLISAFINEGVVDEYIIFIVPLLLGEGVRLFPDIKKVKKLKLKETKTYKNGLLMLRYTAV